MMKDLISNVGIVIKDKNIQELATENTVNFVYGLLTGDKTVIPSIIKNTSELVYSVPNIIFCDKMYSFLTKAFSDYEMQVKFAARFEKDNARYNETVKKIVQIVEKIDFDEKIDWFANLTRSVCLELIDIEAYLHYSTAITMLSVDELKNLKTIYGQTELPETPTLSNYFTYSLTERIFRVKYGVMIPQYTISKQGIELIKYGIEFDNSSKYILPETKDGDKE
ncbi:MAG: hypothetical protein IJE62_02765 [Clostridia bacterium]|nr:hypothetical protein [Clostridia bacterium]